MEKLSSKHTFLFSIIFTTIFMGSSFPTGKYLISVDCTPPFYIGGWRFLIAGLLMLLITLVLRGWRPLVPASNQNITKGIILVIVIGLLQTAGTMGFLNLSMAKGLSSSMSSIILFTNPLWLAFLAHFLLNDKLTKLKVLALFLGITGVVICLGLDKSTLGIGAFYALLGSLCWAVNTVVTKMVAFDKGPWVLTGWQLFIGGFIMLIISAVSNEHYHIFDLSFFGWFNLIWLIIPASIGSFGLWFLSLRIGGATVASSFLFLVPVSSTIFSIIWLHEKFTFSLVIGGLFVVIALIIVNHHSAQSNE
ncbi:MAG: DMT family transporter [Staphylococcus simulans]|nr:MULTISPECIES: DMT family transporter [Staphylococcus]MDK7927727.1 DMT family transporter [Staphylococcus simulans]MDK8316473.1 DMT family transporter [Staphylococcus simulans]OHR45974.1 hypothetical protein HMPREF2951_07180 [Staphylococcus sp. HMSC056D08]OHS49267.1 hypothetical protein HMPREF3270_01175 [Staphylococcus sp. HMSC65H10]